jgi:hypothetical protein
MGETTALGKSTGLPDGIIVLYMCHGFSGVKPGWIVKTGSSLCSPHERGVGRMDGCSQRYVVVD